MTHETLKHLVRQNIYQAFPTQGYSKATWKYTVWVVSNVSSRDICIAYALSQSTAGSAIRSVDLSIKFPW